MTLRSRIERLEAATPDPELSDWVSGVMIAPDYTGPYALHAVTGEESKDPDLLARLELRRKQRAEAGVFETFEVIIGRPAGYEEGQEDEDEGEEERGEP